jgi:hypothetical protein
LIHSKTRRPNDECLWNQYAITDPTRLFPTTVCAPILQPGNPGILDNEECIHATWFRPRKIAARQPRDDPTWQFKERRTILLAYKYALGLPNKKITSSYRDALVDAMAEHMNDYGFSPGWDVLADAIKGHGPYPLRQLVAFQYVLTTDPSEFKSNSRMRLGVVRLGSIRKKFDACWRRHLDEVRQDGRTYRDI